MSTEITTKLDGIASDFNTFKSANDTRLKALEAKGYAPADLTEKVNTIAADLAKRSAEIDGIIAAANRAGASSAESKEEQRKKAYEDLHNDMITATQTGNMPRKAIAVGGNTTGGYAVSTIVESDMARVLKAASPMRQLATVVQKRNGTSAFTKLVAQNDAASANTGENASARSDTNSGTMQQISITPHTIEAQVVITPESFEDTVIDPENWLFQDVVEQFTRQEGTQFVTGVGSGNVAFGFAGSGYTRAVASSYSWGDVKKVISTGVTGSGSTITHATYDDIIGLVFQTLDTGYQVNGALASSAFTLGEALKLKDTQGRYLVDLNSAAVLNNAKAVNGDGSLIGVWSCLGKTWNILPDMANYEIAFADFKRFYYIVDAVGLYTVVDMFSKKPNTEFYFRKRTGGAVVDYNAGAILALS